MDSPQSIIKTRTLLAIEPYLAWCQFPNSTNAYIDRAIWIGDRRGAKVLTHGVTCIIDGLGQYQAGRYSPLERRNVARCGFVLDLYQPEDINADEFNQNLWQLNVNGLTAPALVESMDGLVQRLLNVLHDTLEVQTVRMLPPMQRGVYGDKPVLERVKGEVLFLSETCLEPTVA